MSPYDHPLEQFEEPLAEMPPLKWWERYVWEIVIGSGLTFYALLVGAWWTWRAL